MNSKSRVTLIILFLISSTFITLSNAVEIKLTNKMDPGTDIPIVCYNGKRPSKDYVSKTLTFQETMEFDVYTGLMGDKLVACDVVLDGETRFFIAYSNHRDKNVKGKCWWYLNKEQPCLLNRSTGEYDDCYAYLEGSFSK